MSSNYFYQRPLPWEDFEQLMKNLNEEIEQTLSLSLASIQTAIAIGCYLGPKPAELFSMNWRALTESPYYFKSERNRKALPLEEPLRAIITKNRKIINPDNSYNLILVDSIRRVYQPISPSKFKKRLSGVLDKYGIVSPEPNVETLRKTFARKKWLDSGRSNDTLRELSYELSIDNKAMLKYVSL